MTIKTHSPIVVRHAIDPPSAPPSTTTAPWTCQAAVDGGAFSPVKLHPVNDEREALGGEAVQQVSK